MKKKKCNDIVGTIVKSIIYLFIIFCPNIRFFPKYSWLLAGAGILTLLDSRFRKNIKFLSLKNMLLWLLMICNIVVLGCITPIIHGTNDNSYIRLLLGIVLTMSRCLLLVFIAYKTAPESTFECFTNFFLNACCLYVGFTITFIISPGFKQFWLHSVLTEMSWNSYYAYQFRYSIDGFAAFSSSSTFAFATLLSGYKIAENSKYKFDLLLKMIICIIGCFFYGRIALFGIILGIVLVLTKKKSLKKNFKILWRIGLVIFLLILLVEYLATINDSFLYWKEWAFAIIKELFINKKITDHSVTHMFKDMYYMPDIKTFLIGSGYYTDPAAGGYYGHTDVGFMRVLLYAGLPGIIFSYFTLLHCVSMTFDRIKNDKLVVKFLMFFVVLWLVLECKGEAYHRMLSFLYPLYLAWTCEKSKSRRRLQLSGYIEQEIKTI